MQAAYLMAPETLELRPAELPLVPTDHVSLQVLACGICGSNLHGWRHPELSVSAEGEPEPGAAGHEIAAVVDRIGESVEGVAVGDLVVVEPNLTGSCGRCSACISGRAWFCRRRNQIPIWGFADQMVVPQQSVFAVDPALDPATATLVEPLACGVHAFRASATAIDQRIDGVTAVVLGAGVAGLLTAAAARHLGAATVAILARHDHQAEAAKLLGVDHIVRSEEEAMDTLRPLRPNVVVEAVGGSARTFDLAMQLVGPGGEVVVLGLFDEPQTLDTRRAVFRELRLFFPVTYQRLGGIHDFEIALSVVTADPEPFTALISHRFPLTEIDAAFATAADKSSGSLRVVVEP